MKALFTRPDVDAETILALVGVEYVVKEICLEEVDWAESSNNCARLWHPLNEERIDEYGRAMMLGDVFPMPVVEVSGSGLIILGGNQRLNAAKRISAGMTMNAYVVKPLIEAHREMLIRSLNSRHGWGSEKNERAEHATYLVRKHGVAVSDAARLMMVSESVVSMRVRAEETKAFLARKGVQSHGLPLLALSAIGSIQDERQAVSVAKIAVERKATADQVSNIAAKLKAVSSSAEKQKAVREFDSSLSSSIRNEIPSRTAKRPRREKIYKLLEAAVQFMEHGNSGSAFGSLDELQCIKSEDHDRLKVLVAKLTIRLNTILEVG
jgi:hypothetical protein